MRVGLLQSAAVELFHVLGGASCCPSARRARIASPRCCPGRTSTVSPLRHMTSVTRRMCSLSRVTSAGDSKVLLPSGAARGEQRFQRYGVFGLIPSNIPGHRCWTSPRHRCVPHRRSVLHWSNMSRNQSRTMESAWILRRFAVLPLQRVQRLVGLELPGRPGQAQGVLV